MINGFFAKTFPIEMKQSNSPAKKTLGEREGEKAQLKVEEAVSLLHLETWPSAHVRCNLVSRTEGSEILYLTLPLQDKLSQ